MDHKNSIEWLRRTEEYHLARNGMGEVVDDFDEVGKLGSGFASMDKLKEVCSGNDEVARPNICER
jgi:hypothetical protein